MIVTLPNAIKINGSGSFVVYYRALGYAKKNLFGAFNFSLETLKVEDKIRNLQVGINTDSDLFLHGAAGKVNYRFDESALAGLKSSPMTEAVGNPQLDSFYQQIGQGIIAKTASNLQPLESFTVKGSYADSYFKLYAKGFFVGLMIIILFFILIYYLIKNIYKKLNLVKTKPERKLETVKTRGMAPILETFGLSFVVSFLILAYTFFVFIFGSQINRFSYSEFNSLFIILIIIISICIYALLFFGPAIFLGLKKGIGLGLSVLVLTVLWLIFYMIVIFVVLFFVFQSRRYPIPDYSISGSETKTKTQPLSNP